MSRAERLAAIVKLVEAAMSGADYPAICDDAMVLLAELEKAMAVIGRIRDAWNDCEDVGIIEALAAWDGDA